MPIHSRSHKILHLRLPMLQDVSLRVMAPNLITAAALCAGLTAVKMAFDGRYEAAVIAILLAAGLDALDGRVARLMHGTSKFGEEFDSLADAISFGVAPALLIYLWSLHTLGSFGWIAALVFAVAIALRLARFNVSIGQPQSKGWRDDYFCGMPAPAAALCAMLPLYLSLAGIAALPPLAIAASTIAVAGFAISTVPFYAGKRSAGSLVRTHRVAAGSLAVVFMIALVMQPWAAVSAIIAAYLVCIPVSVLRHRHGVAAESPTSEMQP